MARAARTDRCVTLAVDETQLLRTHLEHWQLSNLRFALRRVPIV
jgi:hypothetical protein